MTITVQSLCRIEVYNLPFYDRMPAGRYLTHVIAPALECQVGEDGSVLDGFILNGAHVFTKDNKDKALGEIMQDGAVLHHTLALGPIARCLFGNGNRVPPTGYQLTLRSSNAPAV